MVSEIFATRAEHADVKAPRRLSGYLVVTQQLGQMPDDCQFAYARHKDPPSGLAAG